jgi:SAM-dependent methyltransferase
MLRDLRRLAYAWWKDLKNGRRSDEPSIPLQPFAFWPTHTSAICDTGGTEPSIVPGYAFHTSYVLSTGGTVRFRIKLSGLTATRGKLLLSINRLDEQGVPSRAQPKIKEIALAALAANGNSIEIAQLGLQSHYYAVMGILTGDSDARAERIDIFGTGIDNDEAFATRLDAAREAFLSAPGTGILAGYINTERATLEYPRSQMCTAYQMGEPIYAEWCHRMGSAPGLHRKQWEFVFILRALDYYGALREGARGLGFGVGVEPLSSLFAAAGCRIVATDLAQHDERSQVWDNTQQLGANLDQIFQTHLCDRAAFYEQVSFRPVDMNAIPADLRDFDFTWSSCAYEHLGSIEAGLTFFENSLACLKPGGIAVHTTELNLSSNKNTLDTGTTVLFRRRDFETLARRLIAAGHDVIPITFDSGDSELDRVIDMPPYSVDSHLKLALLRWVSTSFGMIVRKGAGRAT